MSSDARVASKMEIADKEEDVWLKKVQLSKLTEELDEAIQRAPPSAPLIVTFESWITLALVMLREGDETEPPKKKSDDREML